MPTATASSPTRTPTPPRPCSIPLRSRIRGAAQIEGTEGLLILGQHEGLATESAADAESFNLGGDTDADPPTSSSPGPASWPSRGPRSAAAGSTSRPSPAPSTPRPGRSPGRSTSSLPGPTRTAACSTSATKRPNPKLGPTREIVFNANVEVLPVGLLDVDSQGNVQAFNIAYQVLADKIVVQDVQPAGTAVFKASDLNQFGNTVKGSIQGSQSTFTFRETFDTVRITNASPKKLEVHNVTALNTSRPSTVEIDVEQVQFDFDVTHSFAPTELVEIRNTSTAGQRRRAAVRLDREHVRPDTDCGRGRRHPPRRQRGAGADQCAGAVDHAGRRGHRG